MPLFPDASNEAPGTSPGSAVSVSALAETARDVLHGAFLPLWVRGEVCDFKAHRNGHWYFCLRDGMSQLRCVVWSRDRARVGERPADGMAVAAFGQVSVYVSRGDVQLVVTSIQRAGDGERRQAMERALEALRADGMLEPSRRRRLPRIPACVGIVTSPDGAALHDIVSVGRRRWPGVRLVLVPAAVQGTSAPEELCSAIERVGRWNGADVVIIGRGGGANEDLSAFNQERVARAVANCPVPVVSAVGHEVDVTLCDLVADARAATPSAAAELVIPDATELRTELRALARTLSSSASLALREARARGRRQHELLDRTITACIERQRGRVALTAERVQAVSPVATLARGYAVVRTEHGATVRGVADVRAGDALRILLGDGDVLARAEQVEPRARVERTA